MTTHPALILLPALLIGAASAHGQQMEKWGYPDPDTFARATYALCHEQHMSVLLATRYRDQGKTKDDVIALIPENPPALQLRALDAYREAVEDVYAFPQIGLYSMMAFRAEVCRREVMSARTFRRLASVHDSISACESVHGRAKSEALHHCVRKVVSAL